MLVLMLLLAGVLTWVLTVALTTWALLRPPRLTPARALARLGRMSPSDLGLRFEEVEFRDQHTGRIAGWWVPAHGASDRTVLIIHGYADSRIGALAWAKPWHDLAFNVLLIDLPAHGESGGKWTTAGLRERHLVSSIIGELSASRAGQCRQIFLFGVSMGAAIALAAAELCGDSLEGVVVDSPVADFAHGARTQLDLMGLPSAGVVRGGLRVAELLIGQRFSAIRPVDVIARITVPVLVLLPLGNDPFLPEADARKLRAALDLRRAAGGMGVAIDFPGAPHLQALHSNPDGYMKALNQFASSCKGNRLARTAPAAESRPEGDAGLTQPANVDS